MDKKISQYHNIFFAGIGGIGMSGLAQLLVADGVNVSGSDLAHTEMVERLQEQGIHIVIGQTGEAVTEAVDLLVYSDALPEDHPERVKAKALGIPSWSYFEALGAYAGQFARVIAISGTHGKTTTTAMIAQTLIAAELNPTALVGSIVPDWKSNVWQGSKDTLIVEACEHRAHMLNLRPDIIVLTNIEFDHPDYYRDLDHVVETFQQYVDSLPVTGALIFNNQDPMSHRLHTDRQIVRYDIGDTANGGTEKVRTVDAARHVQQFVVNGTSFTLPIPGAFNISNALACITLARHIQIPDAVTRSVLEKFTGVWRRFQILGETAAGAIVVSDYAHHPTAVAGTMTAAREFYPDRRLVAVFQPHQRTRTQELLTEFVNCFQQYVQPQDKIIIAEIYDVAGREESSVVLSSRELVEKIRLPQVIYAPDLDTAHMIVEEVIEPTDVVLVMGAGDVYRVAEELAIRH